MSDNTADVEVENYWCIWTMIIEQQQRKRIVLFRLLTLSGEFELSFLHANVLIV